MPRGVYDRTKLERKRSKVTGMDSYTSREKLPAYGSDDVTKAFDVIKRTITKGYDALAEVRKLASLYADTPPADLALIRRVPPGASGTDDTSST